MELIAASAGSYPRIGDEPGQDALRTAIIRWERTKGDPVQVEIAQNIVTHRVLEEQGEAGVDLVTDGLIRWSDPISYFPEHLEGIRIGGLARYYGTHLYFRQPIVVGKLNWIEPSVAADYMAAQAYTRRPVKPVFTGPLTLAKNTMVRSSSYRTLSDLVLAYSSVLAREVGMVAGLGATIIQIDEPAILEEGIDIGLVGEAVSIVGQWRGPAEILLNLSFGEASKIYPAIQSLPVNVLGLDLVSDPRLAEMIAADGSNKALSLGLLDGRNTRLEDPFQVLDIVRRMVGNIRAERCFLTTSCGLEFLPRDRAKRKLERVSEIARLFTNGGTA